MAAQTQTSTATVSLPNGKASTPTEALLEDLAAQNTKPLWTEMAKLNPPLPNPTTIPHVWDYEKIRPHLLRAGELVTEKQAERRVAMLINPARSMSSLYELCASTLCSSIVRFGNLY